MTEIMDGRPHSPTEIDRRLPDILHRLLTRSVNRDLQAVFLRSKNAIDAVSAKTLARVGCLVRGLRLQLVSILPWYPKNRDPLHHTEFDAPKKP